MRQFNTEKGWKRRVDEFGDNQLEKELSFAVPPRANSRGKKAIASEKKVEKKVISSSQFAVILSSSDL